MIRWISDRIGAAARSEVENAGSAAIIDVRDLVDGSGNDPKVIRKKIDSAIQYLRSGRKVIVCCDQGISRSVAVATGIFCLEHSLVFGDAVRRVLEAIGTQEVKPDVLAAVEAAIGGTVETRSRCRQTGSRRILVLGAGQGIAAATARMLGECHEVLGVSKGQLNPLTNPLDLDLFVDKETIEVVVHFVGSNVRSTAWGLGEAVAMLRNVLEVCRRRELWLLFLSGYEIFLGYREHEITVTENTRPIPKGHIGETKYLGEKLLACYAETYGLRYTAFRPGVIYGPLLGSPAFLNNFVEKAQHGEDILTHRYSNGLPVLDMLYVDDFARGVLQAIDKRVTGPVNLGSENLVTTNELAHEVRKRVRSASTINFLDVSDQVVNVTIDSSMAASCLGWQPTTRLDEGLKRTLKALG